MALASWSSIAQDEAGNVVTGAAIEVRSEISGLLPVLYADAEALDALGNPFVSEDGIIQFFAPPDYYRITATLDGKTSEIRHVNVGAINRKVGDPQDVYGDAYDAINHRYNNEISGLAATTTQAAVDELAAKVTFTGALLTVAAGSPLPAEDIGPIYHVDYADTMTWQAYTANGAAYTGYASDGIGDLVKLGRSTPRRGTLKLNGADVSATTYAALYGWAKHHGLVDTSGVWAAGTFRFREASGGTFRLPDLRGEFERAWDDGRGMDSGRALGSWQDHQLQEHKHSTTAVTFTGFAGADAGTGYSAIAIASSDPTTGNHGGETRARNVAVLYAIKF